MARNAFPSTRGLERVYLVGMTSEAQVRDRDRALGCLGTLLPLVGGFVVGVGAIFFQASLLVGTWTFCANQPAPAYMADHDSLAVYGTVEVIRLAVYWASFEVAHFMTWRLASFRSRALRVTAGLAVAFLICSILFSVDISVTIGMPQGAYLPSRCPGGYPAWWPF